MSTKKIEMHGYLYILIGATLWGVSSVVAKSLFNIGLPPVELILVRLTLAADLGIKFSTLVPVS